MYSHLSSKDICKRIDSILVSFLFWLNTLQLKGEGIYFSSQFQAVDQYSIKLKLSCVWSSWSHPMHKQKMRRAVIACIYSALWFLNMGTTWPTLPRSCHCKYPRIMDTSLVQGAKIHLFFHDLIFVRVFFVAVLVWFFRDKVSLCSFGA